MNEENVKKALVSMVKEESDSEANYQYKSDLNSSFQNESYYPN